MIMTVTIQLGTPNLKNYPGCKNEADCVKYEQKKYDEGEVGIEDYLILDERAIVIFREGS